MRRNLRVSICTGLVLVGAALAACSGGGSGSHIALPIAAGTNAPTSGNGNGLQGPTAKIVLTIPRHTSNWRGQFTPSGHHLHVVAVTRRTPKYVGGATQGLQITVAGNGASKTVYVDVSPTAPPCTQNPDADGQTSATCTVSVPVVAASETLTVDTVDVPPTNEGANGNPPGYGSGFTGGHVLGAGTTTASLTAGQTTALSLQLGQVVGAIVDAGAAANSSNDAQYDLDPNNVIQGTVPAGYEAPPYMGRAVFTLGQAGWMQDVPVVLDWDGDVAGFASPSPAFVDVNASPVAITATSNVSHVAVSAQPATTIDNLPPTPPPYASLTASTSIVDQSYLWYANGYFPVLSIVYDGSTSATSGTIGFTNGLTATDLFGNPPYTISLPYAVAFVSASPTSLNLSLSTSATGTVTGSDYLGNDQGGMDAPTPCLDSGSNQLATVTAGTMNTTTWQQPFTVTATATGTCTFHLEDATTAYYGSGTGTGVPTQTVTVTIGN